MSSIPLAHINVDCSTQARTDISSVVIGEYAEAMKAGAAFPAVVLFGKDGEWWIGDGFHRVLAAKQAGRTEIEADVRDGDRRAALLHAVGANEEHGLRRTNADKRRAVLVLLEDDEWSRESDRWIAKAAHVSHTYVAKLRASGNVASAELVEQRMDDLDRRFRHLKADWQVIEERYEAGTVSREDAIREYARISREGLEIRNESSMQAMEASAVIGKALIELKAKGFTLKDINALIACELPSHAEIERMFAARDAEAWDDETVALVGRYALFLDLCAKESKGAEATA